MIYSTLPSIEFRDSIPTEKLHAGMVLHTRAEKKYWILHEDLSTWIEIFPLEKHPLRITRIKDRWISINGNLIDCGCEQVVDLLLRLQRLAVAVEGDPREPDFRRKEARELITPSMGNNFP